MKHNYKIRVDQPVPSDEQIDRHRDFDSVLDNYRTLTDPLYRRPLYKNPRTFLGLLLILVIGFLVFEAVEEEEKEARDTTEQVMPPAQNSFLQPVLPELVPEPATATVQPALPETLNLGDGWQLRVPAEAFAGRVHPIDLRIWMHREPLSAALNGWPLEDERQRHLLSTVAVQIEASCQGQPIDWETPLELVGGAPANPTPEPIQLFSLNLETRLWEPIREGTVVKTRQLPPALSTKLDDGLGAVTFGEDGSVHHDRLDPENSPDRNTGEVEVSRVSQLKSPGRYLLGRPGNPGNATQNLEIQDETGNRIAPARLFQLLDGLVLAHTPDSSGRYQIQMGKGMAIGTLPSGRLLRVDLPEGNSGDLVRQAELSSGPAGSLSDIQDFLQQ